MNDLVHRCRMNQTECQWRLLALRGKSFFMKSFSRRRIIFRGWCFAVCFNSYFKDYPPLLQETTHMRFSIWSYFSTILLGEFFSFLFGVGFITIDTFFVERE